MTVAIFEAGRSMIKSRQPYRGNGYMPDWPSWSIREASQKTGYHPEYLRQLIDQGKIEAEKVGHMWLIKIESLNGYIKEAKESGDARFGPHNPR